MSRKMILSLVGAIDGLLDMVGNNASSASEKAATAIANAKAARNKAMGKAPSVMPIETTKDGENTIDRHPSFATIVVTRTQGDFNLFGSQFNHGEAISLEIMGAENIRHHHRERTSSRMDDPKIKIVMSKDQWATMLCSMGQGEGTPCTIWRENGMSVSMIPTTMQQTDRFRQEGRETIDKALSGVRGLHSDIETLMKGSSKASIQAAKSRLVAAERQLSDMLPFISEMFDEHMEKTVSKAKIEIGAYQTSIGNAEEYRPQIEDQREDGPSRK